LQALYATHMYPPPHMTTMYPMVVFHLLQALGV
jgi:hypothetical protein